MDVRSTRAALAGVVVAWVAVACGASGPTSAAQTTASAASPLASASSSTSPPPPVVKSCAPNGTELHVSAQNKTFDTTCLAAPAGRAFTIVFDNEEANTGHNVSIYTDDSATDPLFLGGYVIGPSTKTYHVGALKPGTSFFRCDIHRFYASMQGTFIVR